MNGLYKDITPDTLIHVVDSQGGIVIFAHPYLNISENKKIDVPEGISAVEVLSTVTNEIDQKKSIELCHRHNLISVAGSDAHCRENVGAFYTLFPHLPRDEKDLAGIIRKGKVMLPYH